MEAWRDWRAIVAAFGFAWFAFASVNPARASDPIHADQGGAWTQATRLQFYSQDQGSQLIPLAWLKALRQADGAPFLREALARYGYLPNPDSSYNEHLPIGFTLSDSRQGLMVGMTCSACHTRQINVGSQTYQIDGGPAFADFGAFVKDLDDAVRRVLASPASFQEFATQVLGGGADASRRAILNAEVELWSLRFHALVAGSVPSARPWGSTRLDAIAVIYNELSGLDVGPEPTGLIASNIAPGDAPTRYPFLWNVGRQDFTQWTGVAENGNATLALARSVSEIYGVFGHFYPRDKLVPLPLNRDYLAENSTSFSGLFALEGLLDRLGPPAWPGPLDHDLARQGERVFNRPTDAGGCVACHGVARGQPRPPNSDTWRTPVVDVGTDTRAWEVLLRPVSTGRLQGANVPGVVPPLAAHDLSLNVLKVAVLGTIVDYQTFIAGMPPKPAAPGPEKAPARPVVNAYEARVLRGIWAAAPYLHNGSVPSLAALLEPVDRRPARFAVGPVYDFDAVGLAAAQSPSAFVLQTTDCAERGSGDSRCGHDYGTRLSPDDKKALLEYLKTL
jgi:cytochrome c553